MSRIAVRGFKMAARRAAAMLAAPASRSTVVTMLRTAARTAGALPVRLGRLIRIAEEDIITAFRGRTLAGALAVGTTSTAACATIVHSCTGRKMIAIASTPVSFTGLASKHRSRLQLPRLLFQLVSANLSLQLRTRRWGIRTKMIFGTTLKANEVSTAIYQDFLPSALAEGRYVAAPKPYVVGHGLEHVQNALDIQLKGVSAQKVVVSLTPNGATS